MEQDLLGYLLDGLDTADSRRVEDALEKSAELRAQLVRLRLLVQPLEADAGHPAPPPELYLSTLRLIAHARVQQPPPRLRAPAVFAGERSSARPWFRRADLLVAASLLFIVGLLIPYAVLKLRREQALVACEENLREHHLALRGYQDTHRGYLPAPDADGPLNAAGAAEVKLKEAGFWSKGMRISCPGRTDHPSQPPSLEEVKRLAGGGGGGGGLAADEWRKRLSGCYAFPLGYWDGEGPARHVEPVSNLLSGETPIMSDRPPRPGEGGDWRTANSPNHGGNGQNVLFQGGHVRFLPTRAHKIGATEDRDIFRNAAGELAPGLHRFDSVLAPSEVGVPAAQTVQPPPLEKE